jgi:hypothetical protein
MFKKIIPKLLQSNKNNYNRIFVFAVSCGFLVAFMTGTLAPVFICI